MKLQSMKCPECMANIEITDAVTSYTCPYCGCYLKFDDEKKEQTFNANIHHINQHIDYTKIAQFMLYEKQDKRNTTVALIVLLGILALIFSIALYFIVRTGIAKSQGKIQAGFDEDYIGENYKAVEAHFESVGFTNIELIDLDDSGLAFWKNGEVELISVGGNTDFESTDWFDPNTKVVISYH